MEEIVSKIRGINAIMGELNNIGYSYKNSDYTSRGFRVESSEYRKCKVSKYGLTFSIYGYDNSFSLGQTIEYDGKSYNVPQRLGELAEATGSNLPHYERSEELKNVISFINEEISELEPLVKRQSWIYCIGDTLRNRGCFVEYNGSSVCNFERNGIIYTATNYDRQWKLNDYIQVYHPNGTYTNRFNRKRIDEIAELHLIGIDNIGKRPTEKSNINKYKQFRVRTFDNKYLDTLKYFDNFDDANAYAKEVAKQKAENVARDLQMYAYKEPKDVSDEMDLLAGYMWYNYQNSKKIVYVMGEE